MRMNTIKNTIDVTLIKVMTLFVALVFCGCKDNLRSVEFVPNDRKEYYSVRYLGDSITIKKHMQNTTYTTKLCKINGEYYDRAGGARRLYMSNRCETDSFYNRIEEIKISRINDTLFATTELTGNPPKYMNAVLRLVYNKDYVIKEIQSFGTYIGYSPSGDGHVSFDEYKMLMEILPQRCGDD